MRLVVAIIFVVAACGGPTQTASTASAKWLEFNRHLGVTASEVSTIDAEVASIDVNEADAFDAQWQKLQRLTDSEMEWLDGHPPDSCYAVTHLTWSRSVTLIGEAAKLYRESIAEHDPTKLKQGEAVLAQAEAETQRAKGSILVSNDGCGT